MQPTALSLWAADLATSVAQLSWNVNNVCEHVVRTNKPGLQAPRFS